MANEIKQLMSMVTELKSNMNNRFDKIEKRIDGVETAVSELNVAQLKILNSIELIERDVKSNKKHIERLEDQELFA